MNDYQKALRHCAEEYDRWDDVPLMRQRDLALKKHQLAGPLDAWEAIIDNDLEYLAGAVLGGAAIDAFRKGYGLEDDEGRLAAAYSLLIRMERNFNEYFMVRIEEDFDEMQGEIREPGIQGRIVDEWLDRARYTK